MIPEKHLDNAKMACEDLGVELEELRFETSKSGAVTALYNGKYVFSYGEHFFDFRMKWKHLGHYLGDRKYRNHTEGVNIGQKRSSL